MAPCVLLLELPGTVGIASPSAYWPVRELASPAGARHFYSGVSMRSKIAVEVVFRAAPSSGAAPLGVQFYATGGRRYAIDFGDGETGVLTSPCVGAAPGSTCPPPGVYHTYRSAGSYTAILRPLAICGADAPCVPPSPLANAVITVSDGAPSTSER